MTPQEIELKHEVKIYGKRGITLVRGEGARVWDDTGKEYIDCVAGHGVVNIGHANPAVVKAIHEQAQQLITCPESFSNPTRATLLQKLNAITPPHLSRFFLCNSGAEAVEAAIKFARVSTGKTEILCAMRGFHGRTMGALSATFNKKYRQPFEPLVPGFIHAPFNNAGKFAEKMTDNTAAVLLEIVQGEGGVNIGRREFFEQVQQLCRDRNTLLIIDEVQTGFCRTGKMFAFEHFDLQPDMVCMAKAMAGGVPIGAVACRADPDIGVGKHGTTFGGNPLAAAAAIAAIDFMLENDLAVQAAEKGAFLAEELRNINSPKIREVRHLGLMVGIELKEKVYPCLEKLAEQGVLALPAGATVLRLLPPLVVKHDEIIKILKITTELL